MRYAGIDYGAKRIGMAVGDEEVRIATPRGVVRRVSDAQAVREIIAAVRQEGIGIIIMGLPLAHDGSETGESRAVRRFAEKLKEKIDVPVEFENEIFTTRMAAHEGIKKENADVASAAIILQSYLDKKRHGTSDTGQGK